jgi:transposase-like protein
VLAAIGWVLGLSYRGLAALFGAFRLKIERMSAWRDVQAYARQLERARHWQQVRVIGLDGAYVRGWGKTQPVLVAVDLGTGQPVTVGYVDEKDPQAVRRFLEPLMQRLGVSVMVTDDLSSYKVVARELNLEHQVCQFHLRRWVGRALRDLRAQLPETWQPMLEEVQALVNELPPEGERRLWQLYRQLPVNRKGRGSEEMTPLELLRHLIGRLAEDWAKYRVFDWQAGVPWTNNGTEQVIGRMKMRARTVRGYKNWLGMASGLMAAGVGVQ